MGSVFDEIRGQERALDFLRAALKGGRFPHAYLFTGPVGVGKFSTAVRFGAALNCREERGAGCGKCRVCRGFVSGRHSDLLVLRALEGKSEISVEQVREMIKTLYFPPFEADIRVAVVDEAESLNRFAANSLLKTLEEPPDRSLIILVASELSRLPVTIVSRCQVVRFGPLADDLIREYVVRSGVVDDERVDFAVSYAGGSLRRALEEDIGACFEIKDLFERAISSSGADRVAGFSGLAERCHRDASDRERLFRVLRIYFRGMIEGRMVVRGPLINVERALDLISDIDDIDRDMRYGRASTKLALDSFFCKLAGYFERG